MDRHGYGGGMFGSYGSTDPSLNPPGSQATVPQYLTFNPALLAQDPDSQFIFPEGSNHRRGRFELAFSQIGGSVFLGGAVGGLRGTYNGLLETKQLTGAVKRTQMLNYITKQGASTAQTLGVIGLMYSLFGVIISKGRGADDELNTLSAAALTGVLFKSSGGVRSMAAGGGVGLGLATVYCLLTSRDRIKQMIGMKNY